jgi:hypothetical protein
MSSHVSKAGGAGHDRNFATISAPLNRLTSKESTWKGKDLPENYKEAIISLKNSLISQPIVDYPRKDRPFSLIVDASTGTDKIKDGIGAMLCQTDTKGEERVIGYASKQLLKNEKNHTHFWLKCNHVIGHIPL